MTIINQLNSQFLFITHKLQASDGLYSTLCEVNITLRDVNNHAPVFSRKHFVTSVEENLPIGMYCFDIIEVLYGCLLLTRILIKFH